MPGATKMLTNIRELSPTSPKKLPVIRIFEECWTILANNFEPARAPSKHIIVSF